MVYHINMIWTMVHGSRSMGNHTAPYGCSPVFDLNMFSPRSAATISLGNAVVVIGGNSDGHRVSTIGCFEKILSYKYWIKIVVKKYLFKKSIFLKPSKHCLKTWDGQKLENYREPCKQSVLYFLMINSLLLGMNRGKSLSKT